MSKAEPTLAELFEDGRAIDEALLEAARDWAERLLQQDPATADRHLARWMHTKIDYLKV